MHELGDPNDERDFDYLMSYSPYHRVAPGTKYPPILISSGGGDTRLEAHSSLRMAARLQAASPNTVLLRYDADQGHGMHRAVTPIARQARHDAEELAFFAAHLGLDAG